MRGVQCVWYVRSVSSKAQFTLDILTVHENVLCLYLNACFREGILYWTWMLLWALLFDRLLTGKLLWNRRNSPSRNPNCNGKLMPHADFSLSKGMLNVDGLCLRKIYAVKVSVVIIQNYLYDFNFIGSAIRSKHRPALLQTESCVSRWWAGSQQLQAVCLTTNWTHLSLPPPLPSQFKETTQSHGTCINIIKRWQPTCALKDVGSTSAELWLCKKY